MLIMFWVFIYFYIGSVNWAFTTRESLNKLFRILENGTLLARSSMPIIRFLPIEAYRFFGIFGILFLILVLLLVFLLGSCPSTNSKIMVSVLIGANFVINITMTHLIITLKNSYDDNKMKSGYIQELAALFLGSIPKLAVKMLFLISLLLHLAYYAKCIIAW